MIATLKRWLYFPIASYFSFWARIQLKKWSPRIILITGSSGKTTLLHLIESQLGKRARYSHHANSSYGIPFDILGLKRKKLTVDEWFYLFFAAPFAIFKKPHPEKLYIVEADCDRPYEGEFLGSMLKPEVTLWISSGRTHSVNFDKLVSEGKFAAVEEAIAYEFGNYLEYAKRLALVNEDSPLITKQLSRCRAKVIKISKKNLKSYKVFKDSTEFQTSKNKYLIKQLLPEESFYAIEMTKALLDYLGKKTDLNFSNFKLPPARSSVFKGIKNITIIDSCYNAYYDSMKAILNLFNKYPAKIKWVVLGDMIEQGKVEKEEHEKLADEIVKLRLERIVLLGPRLSKYTYPRLKIAIGDISIARFENPKEILDHLIANIKGGETILFKGARFLEGVIENLLADKSDVKNLSRREKIWDIRRKKWGL